MRWAGGKESGFMPHHICTIHIRTYTSYTYTHTVRHTQIDGQDLEGGWGAQLTAILYRSKRRPWTDHPTQFTALLYKSQKILLRVD
jgi:hypothetical protein